MKQGDGNPGRCVSGSRRTRSQKAPDWTVADCLVLVNVIAAVEADCLKDLSTFQKWKIIAENCTSLDVARTSDQCRRKWDCLLAEHDLIKLWESKLQDNSYWCLDSGRRKEFGLPEDFDKELFKAIGNLATMTDDQSDSEPDSDPEGGFEMLEEIAEPGPKRQRRRSMPRRNHTVEKSTECEAEEKPLLSSPEADSCGEPIKRSKEKETDSTECEEQRIADKLHENAKLIQAIVTENGEYATSVGKNAEDSQIDFVRCQGNKLITCLGDILNTINDLCGFLEDCE